MNQRTKINLELFKKIYLIRRVEETIVENYASDEMKTPMHMSRGEEAIVTGVCQSLLTSDQVFGTYRSHALYLSKVGETKRFFAEMYGKKTGVVKGKGGSMHLFSPENGFMGTSAVVASNIPVAMGCAYANKFKKNNKVVVVFFGDGAVDEGVFWESLNFACLKKLPIIFVCEDNNLAVHTSIRERAGYESLIKIVSKFNCRVFERRTTDAFVIYGISKQAVEFARRNNMPCFLHFYYYRYLEHVGVNEDFDAGYRSKDEFKNWLKKDPLDLQRKNILKQGLDENEIFQIEREIDKKIKNGLAFAKKSPFPPKEELLKDVFQAPEVYEK
jgi:TPP-dependent pyruvate/acetoin dehydrogenase alpha subunit